MQYGILMFPTRHPVDVAAVAWQAAALGFDSLWVGEHPIMPVHSASPFLGSDSAVLLLTSAPEAAALAELEQIAKAVL
jgi:alkanesulfonate monooxygenase SsuD/methylene tetrahydromethanopterin reductase-like flavin-dependent oxidoreductase (luciferase family)